tara:strand:- start:1800 stop:2078 length:279 start_codon:yes stop_codon:yes gene_type:complete
MFTQMTKDLDLLLDRTLDMSCESDPAHILFDIILYLQSKDWITLISFYSYTFVKFNGSEYRSCFKPLKTHHLMVLRLTVAWRWRQFKRFLGI